MKRISSVIILVVMVFAVAGFVSADTTIIAGKIYNSDYTEVIAGADVTVTCAGSNVLTDISKSDGTYSVKYDEALCHQDNSLSVYAEKGSLTGYQEGIIYDNFPLQSWNLAVVNVPLVPEFGFIIGGLTIMGALGVFFIVRRK